MVRKKYQQKNNTLNIERSKHLANKFQNSFWNAFYGTEV